MYQISCIEETEVESTATPPLTTLADEAEDGSGNESENDEQTDDDDDQNNPGSPISPQENDSPIPSNNDQIKVTRVKELKSDLTNIQALVSELSNALAKL